MSLCQYPKPRLASSQGRVPEALIRMVRQVGKVGGEDMNERLGGLFPTGLIEATRARKNSQAHFSISSLKDI